MSSGATHISLLLLLSRTGQRLAGVFAERGKRTGGHSHPVLHWLLFGHVEQFDFCRLLIVGETTDPERGVVSLCSY